MKVKHNLQQSRWWILLSIFVTGCIMILWGYSGLAATSQTRNSLQVGPSLTPAPPFLHPPFPGSVSEHALFDHESPINDGDPENDLVVVFNGREAECYGPTVTPVPPPTPPNHGNSLGKCEYGNPYTVADYNEHEGIDYGVDYVPLFASADSHETFYAGWYNPQNHQSVYGLLIKLGHDLDNDSISEFISLYGHLSAISVSRCQPCPTPHPDNNIQTGDVIGISGDTGVSSGPHLHYSVYRLISFPNNYQYIDPYGWDPEPGAEREDDPWKYDQGPTLWEVVPDISVDSNSPLPDGEGNALPFPPGPPYSCEQNQQGCVDDDAHGSSPYFEKSSSYWLSQNSLDAVHNKVRYIRTNNNGNQWVRWHWPYNSQLTQGIFK